MKPKKQIEFIAPEPPEHLSEAAKRLWFSVLKQPWSDGRVAELIVGLEAFDLAEKARKILQKEGIILLNDCTGTPHAHPAVAIQANAWKTYLKISETLKLRWNREETHEI